METQAQSISALVDQSLVNSLMEMGFSKIVCEKALFLTQAKDIETAFDWINDHQNDPDFEEELQIVEGPTPTSMTPEDAQRRARELQQKLKQEREIKEKELELQRERERIKSTKELAESKRKFEEQERKRVIDEQMREKKTVQSELRQQQEILRREKEERFGKKFAEHEQAGKTPEERISTALKAIKSLYPNYRNPGVARTCMLTLRVYTSNIANNPSEVKFHSIKLDNKAFQDRVAKVSGGINYLKCIGFHEESGFLVNNSPDLQVLQLGMRLLDEHIATLEN